MSVRGGPVFNATVQCVSQSGKRRFVAEGPRVHCFSRLHPTWSEVHGPAMQATVTHLVAVDDLVFSLSADKTVVVWNGKDGHRVSDFALTELPFSAAASLCVPTHYTNKLAIGTLDGQFMLYNFYTKALLFARDNWTASDVGAANGGQPSNGGLMCMQASDYKDIVALGFQRGVVCLFHFQQNVVLAAFTIQSSAAILSLSFRKDASSGGEDSFLATGSALGEVHIWDLEQRRLHGVMGPTKEHASAEDTSLPGYKPLLTAHRGRVHTVLFHPKKPLLVTAASDNTIKQFSFDTVDGLALLVRERGGHCGPASKVSFYNADLLLTAGQDRALRATHLYSDRASWELSQGQGMLKQHAGGSISSPASKSMSVGPVTMASTISSAASSTATPKSHLLLPVATNLSSCPNRNYQWSSIVTTHDSSAKIVGWRLDHRRMEFKAEPLRTSSHLCTCLTTSQCGNFALVGYSSGHLVRLNLQNQSVSFFLSLEAYTERHPKHAVVLSATQKAARRQLADLQRESDASKLSGNGLAFTDGSAVVAVGVHCCNTYVISLSSSGVLCMHELLSGKPHFTCALPAIPTHLIAHQGSQLCSIAFDDRSVRVFALDSGATTPQGKGAEQTSVLTDARRFDCHAHPVSAIALSPDSERYLVTSSGDGSLAVCDVIAGVCVGMYLCRSPVTSLAFHPDGLFLATTHMGERGAYLWTNNLRYGFAPDECPMADVRDATRWRPLHLPHASVAVEENVAEEQEAGDVVAEDEQPTSPPTIRRVKGRVTLYDASTDVTTRSVADARSREAALRSLAGWGFRLDAGTAAAAGTVAAGADAPFNPAKWQTLLLLDDIRARNQPLLPPKVEKVPFFLPTTQELRPTFIVKPFGTASQDTGSKSIGRNARKRDRNAEEAAVVAPNGDFGITLSTSFLASSLQRLLLAKVFDELTTSILQLAPQRVDLELRTLLIPVEDDDPNDGVDDAAEAARQRDADRLHNLSCALRVAQFAEHLVKSERCVDFAVNFSAAVYRIFGSLFIAADGPCNGATSIASELNHAVKALSTALRGCKQRVARLVDTSSCLVATFANAYE